MTINEIMSTLNEMAEIDNIKAWTKVSGKERIYIDVIRTDREGNRYGGSGGSCYLDLATGKVVTHAKGYNKTIFINSYTKDFHTENGTIKKIEDTVRIA